jgi:hypothetical protein
MIGSCSYCFRLIVSPPGNNDDNDWIYEGNGEFFGAREVYMTFFFTRFSLIILTSATFFEAFAQASPRYIITKDGQDIIFQWVEPDPPQPGSTLPRPPVIQSPTQLPPAPTQLTPPSRGAPSPRSATSAPSVAQVRKKFHDAIMSYARSQILTRGRLAGQPFGRAYDNASSPKALAACINWEKSAPNRLNVNGRASFQFVSNDGTCRSRSPLKDIRQCAIEECIDYAGCAGGAKCILVDVDYRNAISPPAGFELR